MSDIKIIQKINFLKIFKMSWSRFSSFSRLLSFQWFIWLPFTKKILLLQSVSTSIFLLSSRCVHFYPSRLFANSTLLKRLKWSTAGFSGFRRIVLQCQFSTSISTRKWEKHANQLVSENFAITEFYRTLKIRIRWKMAALENILSHF